MFDTNNLFTSGKMTIVMDGGAGSSGKGKLASFIGEHATNWQFCCNAFMSNAAHCVVLVDGTKYLYQTLNSVAYLDKFEKKLKIIILLIKCLYFCNVNKA